MLMRTVNGMRLESVSASEARDLPEGTHLIAEQIWRDNQYKVRRSEYYRIRVVHKHTVAGPDVAMVSDPDSTWPDLPVWQGGWLWLMSRQDIGFWREAQRYDDRVVCLFCKHCLGGGGQLRCRLSGAPVEADDWCPRGEKPGLRRKEDKNGTQETDG